jgi:hypothetical protein
MQLTALRRGVSTRDSDIFFNYLNKKTNFVHDPAVRPAFSNASSRLAGSSTTTAGGANCRRKYATAEAASCTDLGNVAPAALG